NHATIKTIMRIIIHIIRRVFFVVIMRSNEDVRLEMAKLIKNNRILLNNNDFPHEETTWERIDKIKYVLTELEEIPILMCKLLEDVRKIKEELAEYIDSPSWNSPTFFYVDDEESSIQYKEYLEKFPDAVTIVLLIEEPKYSLSMGYEHLSITPKTESDEVTEFNAKNLLPIPNNDDLDSSDDESLSEEDVPAEEFKVYSNPLFDEDEINSDKLDPHCLNVEYDFVESLLNRDTFIVSSSKFDFSGKLAHVNLEIIESDFDFEEEIHLSENLLYVNSSSQPPKEHNVKEERIKREHAEYITRMEMLFTINPRPSPTVNVNTIIESLSSLPIPVQDSDSQREEIDIVTDTDDVLPPSVENDDDTEGEIDVVNDLRVDNSISNSEHEYSKSEESDFDNP
nr:hypothetical protein [Tanacetum cinerariifolium]